MSGWGVEVVAELLGWLPSLLGNYMRKYLVCMMSVDQLLDVTGELNPRPMNEPRSVGWAAMAENSLLDLC